MTSSYASLLFFERLRYADAKWEVDELKYDSGFGVSSKIIIYNGTQDDIILAGYCTFYEGCYWTRPPSRVITVIMMYTFKMF